MSFSLAGGLSTGADRTKDLKVTGSTQFSATTVAMAPHRALSNSMSGLEAMESEGTGHNYFLSDYSSVGSFLD